MTTLVAPSKPGLGEAAAALRERAARLLLLQPRWVLPAIVLLLIAAIVAGTTIRARDAVQYVTAPVAQQTLLQTVTASGTVNPQNNISVGTQVSGTIASIDVDFNSRVRKGQILAKLDPSTFAAQLDQAQAALDQAQAQVAQASATANGADAGVSIAAANGAAAQAAVASANANVAKAQSALVLANQTQTRDSTLLSQGYIAASTVDTDLSTVAQDRADVAAAQAAYAQSQAQAAAGAATVNQSGSTAAAQAASVAGAQAAVAAAAATVAEDQLNLQHTVITSPVDGTVVARDVSVGQTVAASLQTPTLFSIAQNLGQMEVDINVGEPDIGGVKAGDTVNFTVLAYPNRTFTGKVSQVRINPQTVNNVVTYDVVVLVGNGDQALLPGMTANATIDVASANDALVVPTTALAWKPRAAASKTGSTTASSPWGTVDGSSAAAASAGSSGTLFVLRNAKLARVPVTIVLSNGTQAAVTPIAPATLKAGDGVVVASSGASSRGSASGTQRSPVSGAAGMGGSVRGIHP